jgi:hypothetical protein
MCSAVEQCKPLEPVKLKQRKVMERSRFEPGGRPAVNGSDARVAGVPNNRALDRVPRNDPGRRFGWAGESQAPDTTATVALALAGSKP